MKNPLLTLTLTALCLVAGCSTNPTINPVSKSINLIDSAVSKSEILPSSFNPPDVLKLPAVPCTDCPLQLQYSFDLISWVTLPPIYKGAQDGVSSIPFPVTNNPTFYRWVESQTLATNL